MADVRSCSSWMRSFLFFFLSSFKDNCPFFSGPAGLIHGQDRLPPVFLCLSSVSQLLLNLSPPRTTIIHSKRNEKEHHEMCHLSSRAFMLTCRQLFPIFPKRDNLFTWAVMGSCVEGTNHPSFFYFLLTWCQIGCGNCLESTWCMF